MTELIRKDKLIDWTYREPNYHDSINDRTDMRDFIREMSTITEEEIRAKAIDEFAELLKAQAESLETAIDVFGESGGQAICEIADEIAEQLKKADLSQTRNNPPLHM